jgi:VPDSG-CTERM motif
MKRNRMKLGARLAVAVATVGVALLATANRAEAVTFNLTSCHISTGCPAPGTSFGTVDVTGSGTTWNVVVALLNGNTFVETGAGADSFFLFNAIAGATVTNLTATLNGANVTAALGGLTYTFVAGGAHADGTGDWTGLIGCTVDANCNGASGNQLVNDLHFTVNGMTFAQLTTTNNGGNIFVADILCGAAQTGCAGRTGPVDVTGPPTTVPDGGMTVTLLGFALVGLESLRRRLRA